MRPRVGDCHFFDHAQFHAIGGLEAFDVVREECREGFGRLVF